MKKNSEQNTKKNDRFILEIPADIKQSSETTTPVVSKTLNTPILSLRSLGLCFQKLS
jgi:hypothetical protein